MVLKRFLASSSYNKYFLPKNDNITNHISANTLALLQKYCALNDMSEKKFMHMKPWFASFSISYLEMGTGGYLAKLGIDEHFTEEARKKGKKVIGLETREFHDDVTSGLSDELQNKMLKHSLISLVRELEQNLHKKEFAEKEKDKKGDIPNLFVCWRTGDADGMLKGVQRSVEEHPDMAPIEKRILYDRNDTMTEAIEPYMKGNDTFMVAVGSAHMVGDNGIVEALRKKGYKVRQVCVGDEI